MDDQWKNATDKNIEATTEFIVNSSLGEMEVVTRECPKCKGRGYINTVRWERSSVDFKTCPVCKGSGYVT